MSGDAHWAKVVIRIGNETIEGQLNESPAARDLASRLSLTLRFRDFQAQEKIAALAPPLEMTGMPEGDSAEAADIGWYAPSGNLVLYYTRVGYWSGIARLGTLENTRLLEEQSAPFTATIELADC